MKPSSRRPRSSSPKSSGSSGGKSSAKPTSRSAAKSSTRQTEAPRKGRPTASKPYRGKSDGPAPRGEGEPRGRGPAGKGRPEKGRPEKTRSDKGRFEKGRGEGPDSNRTRGRFDTRSGDRPSGRPRPSRYRDDALLPRAASASSSGGGKRNADSGAVVMGRNSVATLLEVAPARVRAVILEEGSSRERRLSAIVAECKEHRIRVKTLPRPAFAERLERWFEDSDEVESAESLSHQGVFAEVSPKAQPTIYQLCDRLKAAIAKGEKPLIVALDKITDARNFGAILRVADGVGAMAVLTTARHSAQWSPAVAKTASGAEATVDVVTVPNLANGLGQLKQAGAWVIGTSDAASLSYDAFDFSTPTVLVMGSEDRGLGPVVEKACDGLVSIPMRGAVSSLNVAVATAVVAYSVQQRLLGHK